MVLILLAAAAISALLGQVTDSGIIVFVVLVNAALGMYQEGKAGKAAAALAKLHAPEARVIRDGRILSLPAAKLVTGDRVLLEAGDAAPADIRLTQCFQLRCDESSLTGESRPVEKDERPIDAKAPPAQNAQKNMVFMGCPIVYGRGQGGIRQIY